jgi:hypothetical protein
VTAKVWPPTPRGFGPPKPAKVWATEATEDFATEDTEDIEGVRNRVDPSNGAKRMGVLNVIPCIKIQGHSVFSVSSVVNTSVVSLEWPPN